MTNLEIEAFLAVVHFETVSEAAQQLYVTQPALSRRIRALEEEIGCRLFQRQKGIRKVELTKEGQQFLPVAEKWKLLWQETGAIAGGNRRPGLNLCSVGSVSSYLFPQVFRRFLEEDSRYHLVFHNYHSSEAYGYVERGMTDLAFVSDQRYSRMVKTIPAFSEPFVLAGGAPGEAETVVLAGGTADRVAHESATACMADRASGEKTTDEPRMWDGLGLRLSGRPGVSVDELDPSREVRLPWNDEYDAWHMRHFPEDVYPHVYLDQMSLMEEFVGENTWAVVPASVGYRLQEKGIPLRRLENGPPDRMIFYLVLDGNENRLIGRFLYHLDACLRTVPLVKSFLDTQK